MKETSTGDPNSNSERLTAKIKAFGCAAKISAKDLEGIIGSICTISANELLTGMENFEDAACWQMTEDLALIQTVDFFPALLDDPYLFGQVAAVNALSDVYAMGGRPFLALNIVIFPTCDFPPEVLAKILQGGADKIAEAGAVLGGGHSISGPESVYGLAVAGLVHPQKIWRNGGAKVDDCLVLTKAIGTGIGLTALKSDLLSRSGKEELISTLTTLNDKASAAAVKYPIHAATDISGFGLFGHVHEMSLASGLSARLSAKAVPLLPEVFELAEQGILPAATYSNRNSYQDFVVQKDSDIGLALFDLLYDPQTAGGLLFALDAENASHLVADLNESGIKAYVIGQLQKGESGIVEIVR